MFGLRKQLVLLGLSCRTALSHTPQHTFHNAATRRFSSVAHTHTSPTFMMGIETSCDDTCVAIVTSHGHVLCNLRHTSLHQNYGGIVPHLAKRQHARHLPAMISLALSSCGLLPSDLSAVAVTVGPGLGPCLGVGLRYARSFASQHQLRLIPVNHIEAHVLVARLCDGDAINEQLNRAVAMQSFENVEVDALSDFTFPKTDTLNTMEGRSVREVGNGVEVGQFVAYPLLALVVSGGHTVLAHFNQLGAVERLGVSRDDACGETLDKIARMLGLDGGSALEMVARHGNSHRFSLPRIMRDTASTDFSFSFSGLKSAARRTIDRIKKEQFYFLPMDTKTKLEAKALEQSQQMLSQNPQTSKAHLPSAVDLVVIPPNMQADLAASLQRVCLDHVVERVQRAMNWCLKNRPQTNTLVLCGGVASNTELRERISRECDLAGDWKLIVPPAVLCTDNAVMIAWTAIEYSTAGKDNHMTLDIETRMPLGDALPVQHKVAT